MNRETRKPKDQNNSSKMRSRIRSREVILSRRSPYARHRRSMISSLSVLCAYFLCSYGVYASADQPAVGSPRAQQDILLISRYGPPNKNSGIEMNIPSTSNYPGPITSSAVTGLNLMVWSPDFKNISLNGGEKYGITCAGFCNGRLLLNITSEENATYRGFNSLGDSLHDVISKLQHQAAGFPNVKVSHGGPEGPFDETTETVAFYNAADAARGANPASIDKYLFKKSDSNTHYTLFVHCTLKQVYPGCISDFSLKCDPRIRVRVSLTPYSKIDEVPSLVSSVDKLISGMVKTSGCLKTSL